MRHVGHRIARVACLLPADVRGIVEAGFQRYVAHAGGLRHFRVLGPDENPGLHPGEGLAHVAEGGLGRGDKHVREAQEIHLRPRLHVVALVPLHLALLAAWLVEAQQPILFRVLSVGLLDAFQVARVEGGHEHGPGLLALLLILEKLFSPGAVDDLRQDHLERSCRLVENPDLDAHPLRRLSQVRVIVVGDHLPDLVAGVE